MATNYNFGEFSFESEEQGIFSSGSAPVLKGKEFIGLDFDNTDSDNSNNFDADWKLDLFDDVTETGAEASVSVDKLKLGFEAGYELNPGSIDSKVTHEPTLGLPDNFVAEAGTLISLAPDSTLKDGSFTSTSPTATAFVDAVFAAEGSASAKAGFLGATTSGSTKFGIDEQQFNIISVDPNNLELFGDIDELSVRFPILQDKLSVKYVPGSKQWEAKFEQSGVKVFSNISGGAVSAELGNIELTYPQVGIEGKVEGNTIQGKGSDQILDFNLDFDGLTGLAADFIVPGAGFAVGALTGLKFKVTDILELSYDLVDVDAGPTVNLVQDFTINPNLNVDLAFDKSVKINGIDTTSWSGQWADLPDFSISDTTVITPSFSTDATLESETAIGLGLELTVEAFKGKAKVKNPLDGKSLLFDAQIGPFWELDPPLADPDLLSLPVFQKDNINLGGFKTSEGDTSIVGDKIVLTTPDSGINGGIDDGVNDAPEADDDAVTTDEDTSLNLTDTSLFANDFDIDAYDTKTISAIDDSSTTGKVELMPSGDVGYDPTGIFDSLRAGETTTDSFGYTLSDTAGLKDTATVTVTVTGVNDAPEAEDDTVTTDEDNAFSFATSDLLTNDFDVEGDALTFESIDSSSTIGNVNLINDTIAYDPNGQFEYLAVNESTTDIFDYTINDGDLTDTATVNVNVTGVNDVPVAEDDTFGIGEDMILDGDVALNDFDVDASDVLTFSLISGPERGVLTFNDNGSFVYDADSDVFDVATPGELFVESFIYEVNDGNGGVVQAETTLNVDILDDGETFFGTNQPDELIGTDGGEDTMYGNNGADVIMGLDGADILYGENGSDILNGGESVDKLYGGKGSDELTGGDGADEFWIEKSGGSDTITDFEIGTDVIGISGLKNVSSFADISINQQGSNAILNFNGAKVTLEGLDGALLSTNDFIFA
ncbi:Ig-like domain-containing protein [Dapis sp. BLCC M229]|uniref:Ig-like domain-containing protein n=1 Tax=Dapis sp. BLCC M229 TaxID=3400188 RepID=UPI003CF02E7B